MTVWRKRAVEVVGTEARGGVEFILIGVLRSVARGTAERASTPAHVLKMLGVKAL